MNSKKGPANKPGAGYGNASRTGHLQTVSNPPKMSACRLQRTRGSDNDLENPIDMPKGSMKYTPPFRRNFRYFGYPEDLNMPIDTPPRVRSWGPLPDVDQKSGKQKTYGRRHQKHLLETERVPSSSRMSPNYMGRLLKNNLLLTNPGLLPPTDRAVIPEGSPEKLKLICPDLEVTNCPSQLYFPVTDTSRKAFCKINRLIMEKIDQRVKNYKVENKTVMKVVEMEQVLLKDEQVRKSDARRKSSLAQVASQTSPRKTKDGHRFSIVDTIAEDDKVVFDFDINTVSPAVKALCMDKNYPSQNHQVYGRPKKYDDGVDYKPYKDVPPVPRGAQFAHVDMNIPEEVWVKLAKVRQGQLKSMKASAKARVVSKSAKSSSRKFRTFTQMQLRNQVLKESKERFLRELRTDLNTPLPSELFEDNRDLHEPYHDYLEKGELPVQGPFTWKILPEEQPTTEELDVVEKSIRESKARKSFTHNLAGMTYAPRHPFRPLELDWMEKGSEEVIPIARTKRMTPSDLYLMPEYLMFLSKDEFNERFQKAVSEGVKELVGKEMWEMYKQMHGLVEEEVHPDEEEEVEQETPVKVKKYRRKKTTIEHEEDEDEDEEEESGEEEEDELATQIQSTAETLLLPPEEPEREEEPEPDHTISAELLTSDNLPLPDVRFSQVEFPTDHIPEDLQDDLDRFIAGLEAADPVSKLEEDLNNDEDVTVSVSGTGESDSDGENESGFDRNPARHLEAMYQEGVQGQAKNIYHLTPKDLQPPNIKDIFLRNTYIEDIEYILMKTETAPIRMNDKRRTFSK